MLKLGPLGDVHGDNTRRALNTTPHHSNAVGNISTVIVTIRSSIDIPRYHALMLTLNAKTPGYANASVYANAPVYASIPQHNTLLRLDPPFNQRLALPETELYLEEELEEQCKQVNP